MKQVTQVNRSGRVQVQQVPRPALKPGYVLVRVHRSVISVGTERASLATKRSSLWQRARNQPELVAKVIEQIRQYGIVHTLRRVRTKLEESVPLGYSAAGTVVAVGEGVESLKPGDRAACAGAGYASHAEYVLVPKNLCAIVPADVSFEAAAYTTLGAIALQGVRQASTSLGDKVVVVGLGLIGQLTVQLLKADGCAVIAVDVDHRAVARAREVGADFALHRSADVAGIVRAATGGVGADAVIITASSKSADPIALAGEVCREKGRVVLVGDVPAELPRAPYYAKELDFRFSRSYGPGRYDALYEERGLDYPVGYVRWTERRNMEEFLRLLAVKAVNVERLTTHRFRIDEATAAYELLSARSRSPREQLLGVVIEYPEVESETARLTRVQVRKETRRPAEQALCIGFLGAGDFAQSMLLPHVRKFGGVRLVGVCTANGLNASNVARNFGFEFATTEPRDILDNPEIGTVFIATRHNLHARYVIDALKAGKNVFVEKPLALTRTELEQIVATVNTRPSRDRSTAGRPLVTVGFNRRFAPHLRQMRRFFDDAVGPFVMSYRVNAGLLPLGHWTHDPVEGGGRIIGEVCHFIDAMCYLTDSLPTRVYAQALGSPLSKVADDDSVGITIAFADGSLGMITYLANGDRSVPKERLEVNSTQRTAVLENFRVLELYQSDKRRAFTSRRIDKGHGEEVRQFLIAARDGTESPVPLETSVAVTAATLNIVESLKLGVPIPC